MLCKLVLIREQWAALHLPASRAGSHFPQCQSYEDAAAECVLPRPCAQVLGRANSSPSRLRMAALSIPEHAARTLAPRAVSATDAGSAALLRPIRKVTLLLCLPDHTWNRRRISCTPAPFLGTFTGMQGIPLCHPQILQRGQLNPAVC